MLEVISSPNLPARHGFFTRQGGASSGIFAGLNCGSGSTDIAEVVQINRDRVAEAMGVPHAHLVTVRQVHSADVIAVDAPLDDRPRVDAMVSRTPGVLLGILTADCQPVLFHDAGAGVIGAAHAGWRGVKDGVLEATVAAMEKLGARRRAIRAVIGPCISQSAYEVGPEFRAGFLADDPANGRFFVDGDGDRALFDLPAFGLARLHAAGVGHAAWTGHCTYRDAERFFSYRRATHLGEADYGRLISVIRL
jgi:polyphenol oxidase